jgi:MerR family transcriptional regulator, light-induced transcriptional regulator
MNERRGYLRIGELSRRVGVSRELLRAWERRYALLQPARSSGDFRLYSDADEERAHRMRRYLASGLSAEQAAQAVRGGGEAEDRPAPDLSAARGDLRTAVESFDEPGVHELLDRLLATFGIDTVLGDVLLPVLRSLGDGWSAGENTVAQEHFASNVLRGRLLGLARGWGRGSGELAVLACPPREQHDMGLLVFGIALREGGWRVAFLGADTPIATVEGAAESLNARVVVLSAVTPKRLRAVEREIAALTAHLTVAIGGPGAEPALAERVGAVLLQGDPIAAATGLAHSAAR